MGADKINETLNEKVLNSTFELFKTQLVIFLKKEFRVCDKFIEKMLICTNTGELRMVLRSYSEDIADAVGFEVKCDGDCKEAEELYDEVQALKYNLQQTDLRNKKLFPTIPDEMKYESFLKFRDNYSFMDLEFLMANGKELINMYYQTRPYEEKRW